MADELGLEGVEERFCHGVIPAIPLAAHTLDTAISIQFRSEIAAGELNSTITMDHEPRSWPSAHNGFMKSTNRRMPFKRITQIPPHNNAREEVDEDCKIVPFLANFEIGDVGYPYCIRSANGEFTVQKIGGDWLFMS
jgi:hypothetical protein